HDRALAMTSHLPHLLASALAGVLPPELRELTATGFRDTTRVAAGDPSLWTGIFLQNRAALLDALGELKGQLIEFQKALMTGDGPLNGIRSGPLLATVLLKPGVMDPAALSVVEAARDMGLSLESVRSFRRYFGPQPTAPGVRESLRKVLANDAIEQAVEGPLSV